MSKVTVVLEDLITQKGHTLQFKCLSCQSPVTFSILTLDSEPAICCQPVKKNTPSHDPVLIRQLKKFEALCRQIQDSEEILGSASVGVDVGEHHVKVPYKLLLTRLSSSLDLNIGGQKVSIFFRIEPQEICQSLLNHKFFRKTYE